MSTDGTGERSVADDDAVPSRKTLLVTALGAVLGVVQAIPDGDCPDVLVSVHGYGGWTIQVSPFNGSESNRRAHVDRIAALAGLPQPTVTMWPTEPGLGGYGVGTASTEVWTPITVDTAGGGAS